MRFYGDKVWYPAQVIASINSGEVYDIQLSDNLCPLEEQVQVEPHLVRLPNPDQPSSIGYDQGTLTFFNQL